ncbi:MAG: hypothetical protein PWR06_979 [Thermoanaerobacteraceae bacterium]|nr:hypothetical protein [Thermoanaerobacteraceae bacterium]
MKDEEKNKDKRDKMDNRNEIDKDEIKNALDDAKLSDNISFDEGRFLRKAKWISTLRTVAISLIVAAAFLILAVVVTQELLSRQEWRISDIYPSIIRYSTPNTIAIEGDSYDTGFIGRRKNFYLFRMVGKKPIAVGTTITDFQVWGGEQFWNPSRSTIKTEDGREYLLPNMVPALKFFHPAAKYDEFYDKPPREFDLLANVPENSTVEMAVSFSHLLSREEMKALLPAGVEPMWGAITAYSDKEIEKKNYLADRLVGIPLGGFVNGEHELSDEEFIQELDTLSKIPSHSSRALSRTASFLRQNGVKFYGVVVVGKPEALLKLADNPTISAAVMGAVEWQGMIR